MPPACLSRSFQAGSLSASATRLGTPLPTLSRRIRDLERQLKVPLLERSARGTKLTDAGTRQYEHATSHKNGFRLPRTIFLQNIIEDMARAIGEHEVTLLNIGWQKWLQTFVYQGLWYLPLN